MHDSSHYEGRDRPKHWGWGPEERQPDRAALQGMAGAVRERLGFGGEEVEEPVPLERIELPPPRIAAPGALAAILSDDPYERVRHGLGKAYRDVIRGMRGQVEHPPDLVAFPGGEAEIEGLLAWCAERDLAAIPYGGGTSVVGGIEPRVAERYRGAVSIDLSRLDRVLEVDPVSGSARIGAGIAGPALEDRLREHGLTLRHFPQSFEYSTLGGWIATRAGGHFATAETHIDDLVESVRAITPAGEWESRRLPGSGAGPSPDRMLLGSEGILGVITEAWVQLRPRPVHKLSCAVGFDSFAAGAEAVRELVQTRLRPANCRLLDPLEAETNAAGPPGRAVLVLGFESARLPVDGPMEAALEIARSHGGEPGQVTGRGGGRPGDGGSAAGSGEDAAGAWRGAFLAAPYLRDSMIQLGVLTETFETAITWDRFGGFHDEVMDAARRAVAEESGLPAEGPGSPRVSCRFTHAYPDGPAPYYTIFAPARRGSEVAQWDAIKAAASEAVISAGGTITHHHAVGRDHRPWYDRQRPDPFAEALRAAKRAVDPAGSLNPGVLIDPAT